MNAGYAIPPLKIVKNRGFFGGVLQKNLWWEAEAEKQVI